MNKRFTKLAAASLAGAIGLTSALVATASPASAASGTAKITVSNSAGVGWCASMSGYIPMGAYETHGYLNNGAMFSFEVWGDDPIYDDYRYGSPWATQVTSPVAGEVNIFASSRGIELRGVHCQVNYWLNEDVPGDDEIFAHLMVFKGGGEGLLADIKTNVVSGSYGF
jgi:hypothetical protein